MTDNVVDLHKARRSQEEPSEAPDRFKSDNLRGPVRLGDELPIDLAPAEIFAAARQSRKQAQEMAELLEIKHDIRCARSLLNSIEAAVDALIDDGPRGGAA